MAESIKNTFELTSFERMIANYCTVGDLIVMATQFLDSKSSNNELKKETVMKALELLQARHPFWRAYLDIRRKEDQMLLVVMNNDERPKDKIEIEWSIAESKERVIELAAAFNAKMFKYDNKQV